jgi:hypothetical protein
MGMTIAKTTHLPEFGIDFFNCASCNAYTGDTDCGQKLPVLCKKIDNSPRPAYAVPGFVNPQDPFYCGWNMAHVTTTVPVPGSQFKTIKDADLFCTESFGTGWVTAEFHDSRYIPGMNGQTYAGAQWTQYGLQQKYQSGGWKWYTYGDVRNDTRLWMDINDQPAATCWVR